VKNKNLDAEDVSDVESISDTEFDEFLTKTEDDGGLNDENWTLNVAEYDYFPVFLPVSLHCQPLGFIRALKQEASAAKKDRKKKRKDSVSEDENDDVEASSDEEFDEDDDDEDFANAMNEEMSDIELSDADDLSDGIFVGNKPKIKTQKNNKEKARQDMSSLFASAEEVNHRFILTN
jgi:hypothetical protein